MEELTKLDLLGTIEGPGKRYETDYGEDKFLGGDPDHAEINLPIPQL